MLVCVFALLNFYNVWIFGLTYSYLLNYLQVGLGGAEYVIPDGVPLYKYKKRWPLGYGRRRRDLAGWTILDPNTGRPVR